MAISNKSMRAGRHPSLTNGYGVGQRSNHGKLLRRTSSVTIRAELNREPDIFRIGAVVVDDRRALG